MAGDIRSFVVLGLLAFLIFIIYRYVYKVVDPYKGYIKFVAIILVFLGAYIWIVDPERMGVIFNATVDWITDRIEPLIMGHDSEFRD